MIADPERTLSRLLAACLVLALTGCASRPSNQGPNFQHLPAWAEEQPVPEAHPDSPERQAVESALEAFHRAASEADGRTYFGLMVDGGVFLGTDASERWEKEEFRAYSEPFFSQGRGWTYEAVERHVYISDRADVAWFDERLANEKYGDCRGSGVLVKQAGSWRVSQYNLTIPVPNGIAADVVRQIRAHQASGSK